MEFIHFIVFVVIVFIVLMVVIIKFNYIIINQANTINTITISFMIIVIKQNLNYLNIKEEELYYYLLAKYCYFITINNQDYSIFELI